MVVCIIMVNNSTPGETRDEPKKPDAEALSLSLSLFQVGPCHGTEATSDPGNKIKTTCRELRVETGTGISDSQYTLS